MSTLIFHIGYNSKMICGCNAGGVFCEKEIIEQENYIFIIVFGHLNRAPIIVLGMRPQIKICACLIFLRVRPPSLQAVPIAKL